MSRRPATTVPRATEDQCEDAIIQTARLLGYRVHAERRAARRTGSGWATPIKGTPGWPDLVIAGHGRAWFIELKRRPNTPTADQLAWLAALTAAGIDARLRYVPDELEAINTELAEHAYRDYPTRVIQGAS